VKVGIINYGASNLLSVKSAVEHLGHNSKILDIGNELNDIDFLILPGVGDFKFAAEQFKKSGMEQNLKEFAAQGKSILGICLGMQLLGESSNENGLNPGLDLISGKTVHLSELQGTEISIRVPRMGWYPVAEFGNTSKITNHENLNMYFAHSYFMQNIPSQNWWFSSNVGKSEICVGVKQGTISGVQFHPEKSGETGIKVLEQILRNK
jgi:glutamine amidotransferase